VADAILVLNAGSSSLKFETFFLAGPALDRAAAGIVEGRYSFQTAELPSRLLPARRPGA
jgi:acetate kinase